VAQILATFDFEEGGRDAHWRAQLRDLRRILAADYRGVVRKFDDAGLLPVSRLVRAARRHFPEFNERLTKFDAAARAQIDSLGINLRMEEYPQWRPLRAFYHCDKSRGCLIWLNLAHPAGAVAASLGHELGHWYRERLLGSPTERATIGFFNSDFAAHLTHADELFADLFPVLAAYPTAIAQRVFPTGGWRKAITKVAQLDRATLARLRAHLRSNYGLDAVERLTLDPPRRLYYLTSMLHFARLRWALLEEFGL
jgi:hypothetical protein